VTSLPAAFVDANVVLRFLTRTPAHQAEAAASLFARGQRSEVDLVLLPAVVAEIVYVLESVYDYDSERVRFELMTLFDTGCFAIVDDAALRRALALRVTTPVDFVDAYLVEKARYEGLGVATFDRDLGRLGADRMDLV